ncbi:MAG: lipase maturation factor family protein [Bdellovibrio sp.]|nr:lipase maturation factor family protein [Bdellovibrio sp.]
MESIVKRTHLFLLGNETPSDSYHWVRKVLLQSLGFIYGVANLILLFQAKALWGKSGLLPIEPFINEVLSQSSTAKYTYPSLFYFFPTETLLVLLPILGLFCAIPVALGFATFPLLLILWTIQLSFVNSGQLFYGFGWETQLLELTFYSFFLAPFWNPMKTTAAPRITIWAMRWMLFRLMLGAGLIKIRGDECWSDLTCLLYHYETQPNPSPVSFFYHHMPPFFHYLGTAFNHFVELVVPFGFFLSKTRRIAGLITIVFQGILISSGNLSWLNWLTLVMCIPCFDDGFLLRFSFFKRKFSAQTVSKALFSWPRFVALIIFTALVGILSIEPAINLISPNQAMNTSYDGWHLVNSYGAFGSIGKSRYEIVVSGTDQAKDLPEPQWKEFEFHCKPGNISKRPCLITPYHYHLDWQIWFSAMRPELQEEWLFRLAVRLLEDDAQISSLLESVPFPKGKVQQIKMDLYRYQFADWKDWPSKWWQRTWVKTYMQPISLQTPFVQGYRKD